MGVRIGVLSTYPSTQCGIATFTQSLVGYLLDHGTHVGVVRIVDEPQVQVLPVVHQWVTGRRNATREAARMLDDFDVALVQHEYGIFGGPDGEDVLELVALLHVPVITVLHTVLTHPTPHQHSVLAALCEASDAMITMTETARDRLVAGWGIDPARIQVIPTAPCTTSRSCRACARPGDARDRPHLGPAQRRQGHRVGAARPRRARATSCPPRSTASSGRPTRACASARARPTATGWSA